MQLNNIVQQLTISWDIFSMVFAVPCDLWIEGKGVLDIEFVYRVLQALLLMLR